MNETKRTQATPGPWIHKSSLEFNHHWIEDSSKSFLLAQVATSGNAEANARLIAATPELLDVCVYALAQTPDNPEAVYTALANIRELARVAIAKAEGKV